MLMGWSLTLGWGVQSCVPGREQAKSYHCGLNRQWLELNDSLASQTHIKILGLGTLQSHGSI